MQQLSDAQLLASLPETQRTKMLAKLDEATQAHLLYSWGFWARPDQKQPAGAWTYWLILAGRGFGKTRTGAETVRIWAREHNYVNMIGATVDEARDIMIEGESGILSVCPNHERPVYRKSERKLIWPNGGISLIFTADEPERLRGKQHTKLWADEMGAWRYPEAWDQAKLGLRLGDAPQAVITTTPRPTSTIRDLVADTGCHVTRGSTYDNRSNLAPAFFDAIITRYEGTRLGRQELLAEILDDLPGALWGNNVIERNRILDAELPQMQRVVIGVDPSGASDTTENADEIGIIVVGLGTDGIVYIQEDLSLSAGPGTWGGVVVSAYDRHKADRVVAEANFGGAMVEHVIRTQKPSISYKAVTASRGKVVRAEPIAALYEQNKVRHVGYFERLEDQLNNFTTTGYKGGGSPDRADALVWAITELCPANQRNDITKQRKKNVLNSLGLNTAPMRNSSWMGR